MTKTVNRILQIVLFALMAASLILFILFYVNNSGKTDNELLASQNMTDTVLGWAKILLYITIALLIIFPIVHFIKNPKALIKFLGVIVVFGGLFLISYLIADSNVQGDIYTTEGITPGISQLIGSGLIMIYILAGLTILSIVVSAVINAFK
ncbi:MAG: hypothetical protein K9G67_14830 [Bacteroidales bacterium]|nr:hypothetical protein [Bacteroidales bacterium]MCF8344808.1 hypothetical protein [Bacteroidales bacterium]MCF8352571.1 hypothetical protein [Bacteroidales bacterium]MCF8377627.1 hypothetical protein [Bacteroidales bacterium]MCF8402029.1 hypothetical protein [Bacteroidales bacterium]